LSCPRTATLAFLRRFRHAMINGSWGQIPRKFPRKSPPHRTTLARAINMRFDVPSLHNAELERVGQFRVVRLWRQRPAKLI
jgi:hypothetical protein